MRGRLPELLYSLYQAQRNNVIVSDFRGARAQRMHDQKRILPHPRGVRIRNVDLLAAREVEAQRSIRIAFQFLLDVFRGHDHQL